MGIYNYIKWFVDEDIKDYELIDKSRDKSIWY
jgi:ferritin